MKISLWLTRLISNSSNGLFWSGFSVGMEKENQKKGKYILQLRRKWKILK